MAGASTATYSYDGNLKRVKQIAGGQTIYSVYDRSGVLLTRNNATTATKTDYLAIGAQTWLRRILTYTEVTPSFPAPGRVAILVTCSLRS